MNDFNKLVKAQDEYITLLVKEIESMVSIAYAHGWRPNNHEAGALLRSKIAALKQETAKAEQEKELIERSAELSSLKQSIIESGLMNYSRRKEGISFHDQVVFAIDHLKELVGKQPHAEQEGPFPVYDLSHLSEEDKNKFAGEVMKSASESLMATFYSLGLQSHLDQMSINDSNGDKFILAFRKIVDDKLLGPPLPMASSKKEHEGSWKSVVHSSVSDTEAGREYDDHVTITDGRVELYFDGGIDDNDEQLLCNLLNERKIKLDYNHEAEMVADFLENELKRVNALQREQEGLRWVKGDYERLFNQIKGGKRTVCYIDHPRFFQQRDICTIKPNNPDMEFSSRGHGYGGINDPGYCGSEIERFIQLCRGLNAEWLDESAGGDQGEAEAVALLEWLLKSGYNPMFAGYYLKGANRATSEELHKLFKEQSKQV